MEGILGSVATALLVGVVLILLLCWYTSRDHQYWKERNIPFVKPVPIFGTLLDLFRKPFHETEIERYRKYGPVYGHYEGSRPVLSVADPALLKKILLKDFNMFSSRRQIEVGEPILDKNLSALNGEDWKRVRSIMTPTFSTGKLKRMLSIFKDCSKTCVNNYLQYAKTGEPVDLKKIYGAFTMDIIASSSFSTKLDSYSDPNNKFVTAARTVLLQSLSWRFVLFFLFPKVQQFFKICIVPPKGIHFFRDVVLQIIEERKRTGKGRNDFLQLMMDTVKEIEDEKTQTTHEKEDLTENYGKEEENEQVLKTFGDKKLSNVEVIAQSILFFLAGYDTTASTLSFASYLLAINPDVQDKLFTEVNETLRSANGEMTYETLQSMKYLDGVISETLRLYPPAVRLERSADEDYDLGVMGITIPKGMLVTIPTCAMQRDSKYFPEPEKFNPDRFSPEERGKRDIYVYMPFGSGPRNCVGMRFALLEIKVCLAFIVSNFRIKRCSETKVPLEFFPGQQLLQPRSIKVQMEIRENSVKAR